MILTGAKVCETNDEVCWIHLICIQNWKDEEQDNKDDMSFMSVRVVTGHS
jgi:hypothetical protein